MNSLDKALQLLDIYDKAHCDLDAGKPWEAVRDFYGFRSGSLYDHWERYTCYRIMGLLRSHALEVKK